ncbi:MAG TPA: HD domain-containing phosphohydrolase [Rugosimonospora sp.]|nr:HD domain-containing phosphohydrolase [Rugosimonospora sp.]
MADRTPALAQRPPRRVEVLAALSVAIDLGLGQPAEHMLRSAILACRLADRLGLTREQRGTVYYTTLVMWIGCHADSPEYARWFGDDIAVRRDAYLVDWAGLPYLRFLVGNVARGEPLPTRVRVLAELLRDARGQLRTLIHSHCTSAATLARHLGLGDGTADALGYAFERYDGGGLPRGARGDAIPIETRVAHLADVAEVHHRLYGVDAAAAMVRERRGGHLDPVVADAFLADPAGALAGLATTGPAATGPGTTGPDGVDVWAAGLAEAPDPEVPLDAGRLDTVLAAVGDFVDLKCPFTLGHSRRVAELASAAARLAAPSTVDGDVLRRAGYLHDIGRLGVSNQIWSKAGPLGATEWERVRMHPYLGGRVLSKVPGLAAEAALVRTHHEHLDGSGYPLGLPAASLPPADRLLSAAVAYASALEPRPYREPLAEPAALDRLRTRVRRGELDAASVEAVLAAAGHHAPRPPRPAGLTAREAEVLGMVARGRSSREIAGRLGISEKTVRNHIERVYAKIDVSNRVGASLYALQHGLAHLDGDPDGAP